MHVHCLHWLKLTGLLSLNTFCWPCKSMTGEMVPIEAGLQFGCGDLIWLPLLVHICLGLVVEYWSFVSASTCHSYSELYFLCLISSLIKLFPPPTPPPCPSCPPLIYTVPILMNFMKKIMKNWWRPAIIYLSG